MMPSRRSSRLLWCALASLVAAPVALAGCGCDDDELGASEAIVPPTVGVSSEQLGPDSGFHPIAGDAGPNRSLVEVGDEAEWLAMPCTSACKRAQTLGAMPYREVTGCKTPERASDGRLHLRCEWVIRKSCEHRI